VPYKSKKQRGFIHAAAEKGEKWAQKFVKDADKEKQPKVTKRKRVKKAAKKKRR
jgi:hypothetical protein